MNGKLHTICLSVACFTRLGPLRLSCICYWPSSSLFCYVHCHQGLSNQQDALTCLQMTVYNPDITACTELQSEGVYGALVYGFDTHTAWQTQSPEPCTLQNMYTAERFQQSGVAPNTTLCSIETGTYFDAQLTSIPQPDSAGTLGPCRILYNLCFAAWHHCNAFPNLPLVCNLHVYISRPPLTEGCKHCGAEKDCSNKVCLFLY